MPDSFESWCESILRDGQWLCGLALDAISRRCGVKIVVVEERDDGSAFPFVFGPSKSRNPPVILYLRNEHFQLVKRRDGHIVSPRNGKRLLTQRQCQTQIARGW